MTFCLVPFSLKAQGWIVKFAGRSVSPQSEFGKTSPSIPSKQAQKSKSENLLTKKRIDNFCNCFDDFNFAAGDGDVFYVINKTRDESVNGVEILLKVLFCVNYIFCWNSFPPSNFLRLKISS